MERPIWSRDGADWPNRGASRFVEAGGMGWHVQTGGAGPVLLLLHGTGAATHSWRDLAPRLARRFTLVAPDLPGHGFTDAARDRSLPGVAAAVGALCAALGAVPAMIVGHSAGAAIGIRMALDGVADPAVIVSLNGALLPFGGPAGALFPALARLLFDNRLTPQLFALQARLPGQVGRVLGRATGSTIDARGLALYARLFRTPGHCAGALGMMAGWDLETLKADLARLVPPLVLVAAERDQSVPPATAGAVAAIVPRGEVMTMAGVGHLAHEEQPGEVATLIEAVATRFGVLSDATAGAAT